MCFFVSAITSSINMPHKVEVRTLHISQQRLHDARKRIALEMGAEP